MKNSIKFFGLFLLILMGTTLKAQDRTEIQSVEKTVKSVADNIIENTTFQIIDRKTGETFINSENLPTDKKYRVESPYNEWRYWNGVMNISFITLGETLDSEKYTSYALKNVGFVFDHDDYFRKQYESGNSDTDMRQKYRLSLLDDCGAMGAGIIAVQQIDPQKRYLDYIGEAADYIMNKEYRLEDGVYCRLKPYEMTIWGDDLYMSVPFLARMGELSGDNKYFDEAASQVELFYKYLWNPELNIFFHCWYDDIKQRGVAHWGRCNGWIIMAQAELLDRLPDDHPKRDKLIELLTKQIVGISRYQTESGLWHQLIDKQDSYLETSSSSMYTYVVAKAVNEGWIAPRYATVALKGWKGISSKVRADGQVEGICQGTATSTSTYYYYTRPTPLNDIHGLGAFILAGTEMLKLSEKGNIPE
jgi:rhamnogalacturonyl hydrolase YesR